MKKQKEIFFAGGLLLVLFIAVSALIFYHSNEQIQAGYLASEGNAAENFAVLTASNIKLTNAQVTRLKECSYEELLNSEENAALKDMMGDDNFATKVDYAYVMVHLKRDEIKYHVTKENQNRFDVPVGTALDIMWLLDVNVSESAAENVLNDTDSELSRYSYYIEEDALIFGEAPTYIYNSSEWGDHICGYAPLYSVEGAYIGVVGVELQTGDYNTYCGSAVWSLGILITVTLLMLTLIFLFLYRQHRKLQHEKIYTDALTGLGNRTYYNDLFIKYMNGSQKEAAIFALLIADIDLFKKINDTFGHDVGDVVLIEMGEIFLRIFEKKQIVRFGGEEFVAGIWVNGEEDLQKKLEKLFVAVKEHKFTKLELDVSISLGCSYYSAEKVDGWLLSDMLRAADSKLYECKENGRKQYRMEKFDLKKEDKR